VKLNEMRAALPWCSGTGLDWSQKLNVNPYMFRRALVFLKIQMPSAAVQSDLESLLITTNVADSDLNPVLSQGLP